MKINIDIPEPLFWIVATIVCIGFIRIVANIIYPGN